MPEVRPDRDERPEVKRDVERLVEGVVVLEVVPLEEPRDEDEVPRRRDRQELRRALDDPQDERLPVGKLLRIVPHSEDGEERGERQRHARRAVHDGMAHRRMVVPIAFRTSTETISRNLRDLVNEVA